MGRPPRITEPGIVYHVLNRRVMRLAIFEKDADYEAFERVLAESLERADAPRLLAHCLMPNHWHLVVQAGAGTDLSTWMQWLTVTHTHRWHAHYQSTGEGPLYQGRFKSFPVQEDLHFLTVCRYVEGNALRAGLVARAEDWPWSSLPSRRNATSQTKQRLSPWPVDRPQEWLVEVNRSADKADLDTVRQSIARGVPLGTESWKRRVAARLGLDIAMRKRGRPFKNPDKSS